MIFCSQPFNPIIVSILALLSILNIDMISLKAKIEEQLRSGPNCKNKHPNRPLTKGKSARSFHQPKGDNNRGLFVKGMKEIDKPKENRKIGVKSSRDWRCNELNLRISKGKLIVEGPMITDRTYESRQLSNKDTYKGSQFQTTLKPGKRVSTRIILTKQPGLYDRQEASVGFRSSRSKETHLVRSRNPQLETGKRTEGANREAEANLLQGWEEESKLKDEVKQYIFGRGQKSTLSHSPPVLKIVPSKSAVFGAKLSKPAPLTACVLRPKLLRTNFANEYLEPFKTIESPIGQCFEGQGLDSEQRLFSKSNILKISNEAIESNLSPLPPNLLPRPPLPETPPKSVDSIPEFASTSLLTPKYLSGKRTS
jgi:hypothetical protein